MVYNYFYLKCSVNLNDKFARYDLRAQMANGEILRGFESKSFLLASGGFRSSSINANVRVFTATYRTEVIILKDGILRK